MENPYNDCGDFSVVWDKNDDYVCEDEERTFFVD